MLLKNYPRMLQTNKTFTKLIDEDSYIVAIKGNSKCKAYNVYVKEQLVGIIKTNPRFYICFISYVQQYGNVIMYNKEFRGTNL